jgi:hypothetical protein
MLLSREEVNTISGACTVVVARKPAEDKVASPENIRGEMNFMLIVKVL